MRETIRWATLAGIEIPMIEGHLYPEGDGWTATLRLSGPYTGPTDGEVELELAYAPTVRTWASVTRQHAETTTRGLEVRLDLASTAAPE